MTKKTARRGRDSKQVNAVGRPRITLADLNPLWRETMMETYERGGSDIEVRVALAIHPSRCMSADLWKSLQDNEPEFSEAVNEGRGLAEAWWNELGRRAVFTPEGMKFNSVLYIFTVTNRFKHDWQRLPAPSVPNDADNKVQVYIPDNGRDVG